MKRPKVAIFHHKLVVGAGSEVCAVWIVEALKNNYDVSIITSDCDDFELLNRAYFSNLKRGEVNIIKVPIPGLFRKRFNALRWALLANFCRKKSSEFDLMISTYNVMDFGKRGIQLIADFSFDDRLRRSLTYRYSGAKRLFYMDSLFRKTYLKICNRLAYHSKPDWSKNITIANSAWTASIIKQNFGLSSTIIYPPVLAGSSKISWEEKEYGFISLARLSPEKGIERIIEIIRRLRQRGFNLHLHILGRVDDKHYARKLKRFCKENSSWIFLEGLVLGKEKLDFLAQHKFGISGQQRESFGISMAEMVSVGCIAWVPNDGGQVEIVNHPELVFEDMDDAVNKIASILSSEEKQRYLLKHLEGRVESFSVDSFKRKINKIVSDFFGS